SGWFRPNGSVLARMVSLSLSPFILSMTTTFVDDGNQFNLWFSLYFFRVFFLSSPKLLLIEWPIKARPQEWSLAVVCVLLDCFCFLFIFVNQIFFVSCSLAAFNTNVFVNLIYADFFL